MSSIASYMDAARWNASAIEWPRNSASRSSRAGPHGQGGHREIWADVSRRREPVWFRPWQEIEREAVSLRWYESMVLPGLLQTEAYARAVLGGTGLIARGDVERHLATRMARQDILRHDDPPQFTAVVDEAVLRRPVGGPATMRGQGSCTPWSRCARTRTCGCTSCRPGWARTPG